jgi:hypothetical protein
MVTRFPRSWGGESHGRAATRGVLAFCAGLATFACGSDTRDPCFVSVCDITRPVCQQRIFSATACEREQAGAPIPKIRVITRDVYRRELEEAQTEPTANDRTWNAALQLLGMLGPEQTLDEAAIETAVAEVGAFYEPDSKRVTIIEPTASAEGDLFLLSHEFVHSLQDAEVDYASFWRQWAHSTDSGVAISTLIEGEAMVLAGGVLERSRGQDGTEADWSGWRSSLFEATFSDIDKATSPYLTTRESLPYPLGLTGLTQPWSKEGQSAIDAFYDRPHQSLVDWVLDTHLGSTAVESIACYPTVPPEGYAVAGYDTVGISGVMAVFLGAGALASDAFSQSREWRNDLMVTFAPVDPADTGRAVAWRTRWKTSPQAQSFEDAARKVLPAADVVRDTTDVTVRSASVPNVLARWDMTACGTVNNLPTTTSQADSMMSKVRRYRPSVTRQLVRW